MKYSKKSVFVLLISFAITIFIFLKNAWVSEDAYILFRSLEQFIAGNGPVWNPHERVQVFTSPLWYFVLFFVRLFSRDVYLNVIIASFILWLSTVVVLKKIFKNNNILLISILLFSGSTAFFDFTSSGLENVLAYLLIALYFLNYAGFFGDGNADKKVKPGSRMKFTLLLAGLILCVRHDLALLILPPTIHVVFENFKIFSKKQWFFWVTITLSPFILYTLFSLIYYGSPFPNTAYAKLNVGIDKVELIKQGIYYLGSSFRYDIITPGVIVGALLLSFSASVDNYLKYFGYGIILYVLYVISIGGDFMQGRFLSYSYLISTIFLLIKFNKVHSIKSSLAINAVICLYLFFYPHTPFNSPLNYSNKRISLGIADERGCYFDDLSLYKYVLRDREKEIFPDQPWALDGLEFKESDDNIIIKENVGFFGYYSGTEKIIIDSSAITDPFLARLPVTGWWRIGHFRREVPDGYITSIADSTEVIDNPNLNEFYKKVKILTQDNDLFSPQRLKTIFIFNLGAYNHLLPR
jgi:arabinofuranosyltransferase